MGCFCKKGRVLKYKYFSYRQAFGAPLIVAHVNGEPHVYFGSDRFLLLAHLLGKWWSLLWNILNLLTFRSYLHATCTFCYIFVKMLIYFTNLPGELILCALNMGGL